MSTSAWKQPVLWLVFGMPACVVVAAVATIAVAAGDGSTDTVGDAVQRIAQVQIAAVDADVEAARRGVRMRLQRDTHGIVVSRVSGDVDAERAMRLVLRHPARASEDLAVIATPTAFVAAHLGATGETTSSFAPPEDRGERAAPRSRPGPLPQWRTSPAVVGAAPAATGDAVSSRLWRAALSASPTHAWNVELSGDGWRVVGRWPRDADTVELAPAWPASAERP